MMKKQPAYAALVAERKACSRCLGMANPSRLAGGDFDSEQIGPWTTWLSDLDADVMVVGQEWGDRSAFVKQEGKDIPLSATNVMLARLLASIGRPVVNRPGIAGDSFL